MPEPGLLERLAEIVQVHANAKQVYGEPVERNGVTVIPVARVQWGFGGGGLGRGPIERGGGGGGVRAYPIGFIEFKGGKADFRPIDDPRSELKLALAAVGGILAGVVIAKLARR